MEFLKITEECNSRFLDMVYGQLEHPSFNSVFDQMQGDYQRPPFGR